MSVQHNIVFPEIIAIETAVGLQLKLKTIKENWIESSVDELRPSSSPPSIFALEDKAKISLDDELNRDEKVKRKSIKKIEWEDPFSPLVDQSEILLSGILQKQGRYSKIWRRRHFILCTER